MVHRWILSFCRVTVVALLAVLLAAKAGLIVQPRGTTIGYILLLILSGNLFWWAWVDQWITGVMRDGHRGRRGLLRVAWAAYLALMVLPFPLRFMGMRHLWEDLPASLIGWLLIWNLTLAFLAPLLAFGGLVVGFKRWFRTFRTLTSSAAPAAPDPAGASDAPTRRHVLRAVVGAAPLLITGSSAVISAGQSGHFRVRRLNLKLDRLPERLRGLTITHVSDMHVGRLFRPEHLPRMVDACNALDSDILMITGDIVDHDIDFLPPALEVIASLQSRHGRYIVAGNHDLIDHPQDFINEITRSESGYLADQHATLEIGGEQLRIAGLFWSSEDEPTPFDPGHGIRADQALKGGDPDAFTIALAHHPHAFDALAARGVDLTLAGHTHGGQLMLTPQSSSLRLGAGSFMFRYIYDVYRRGSSAMYVNAGVGNWFPVRVNAPAELVQIRLV